MSNEEEVVRTFNEVKYSCSKCSHSQIIRFFTDQQPLPVTNCVECRAGFNLNTVAEMMSRHVGMFPGPVEVVAA